MVQKSVMAVEGELGDGCLVLKGDEGHGRGPRERLVVEGIARMG